MILSNKSTCVTGSTALTITTKRSTATTLTNANTTKFTGTGIPTTACDDVDCEGDDDDDDVDAFLHEAPPPRLVAQAAPSHQPWAGQDRAGAGPTANAG